MRSVLKTTAALLNYRSIWVEMAQINFFTEDVIFQLSQKTVLRNWITMAIEDHKKKLKTINYIFCSDDFLLAMNEKYLHHNTYTDIITFNQSSKPEYLEADIYISITRVRENALTLHVPFITELNRVLIHGVLHLIGFNDKSKNEKLEMRKTEDHYLVLLTQL